MKEKISGFVILSVCLILGLALLQSVAAQTLTTDQVLDKMEKANESYPSLQATISRTTYTDFIKDLSDPQVGKIWIQGKGSAPRRIKVEFDKPQKELMLIDKGAFIHYYPDKKSGETRAFPKESAKAGQAEGECVFLGLCQSKAVVKQYYDVTVVGQEVIDKVNTTVLELKPKDKKRAKGIASIKMWLDPVKWIPLQTRITQENKNYTTAKYRDIKTAKFSDSVFNVKIPVKLQELK